MHGCTSARLHACMAAWLHVCMTALMHGCTDALHMVHTVHSHTRVLRQCSLGHQVERGSPREVTAQREKRMSPVRSEVGEEQQLLKKEQLMSASGGEEIFGASEEAILLEAQSSKESVPNYIIHPSGNFRTWWDVISGSLIIFISLTLPYRLAFVSVTPVTCC